jgi:tetratricopeptide (TPR) repeat protein
MAVNHQRQNSEIIGERAGSPDDGGIEAARVAQASAQDDFGPRDAIDGGEQAVQKLRTTPTDLEARIQAFCDGAAGDSAVELLDAAREHLRGELEEDARLSLLRAIVRMLGSDLRAEPMLRELVEKDPADLDSVDALGTILLARTGMHDFVAFLEERLRGSGTERNGLRVRLASLYARLPGGEGRALELLEEAHAMDASDREVLVALDARCVASDAYARLVTVLEARIDVAETEAERVELLLRLVRLLEREHGDADRAAQRLEQLVEIAPESDEAFAALARCYGKLRLWDAAVFAFERHVEATSDDEQKLAAYCGMARVLLEELDLPDRALEAYSLALDLDPDRAATLEALGHVHERLGDSQRAMSFFGKAVERETDPRRKAEGLSRLAELTRTRLGDLVGARNLHRQALEIDGTYGVALTALRMLCIELDDVDEGARLLDREQRVCMPPAARAKLLVELAVLRRDRLDDPHGARIAFEEAYGLDRENEAALFAVAEAKVERCEWSVVTNLLDRLARSANRRPTEEQQRIFGNLGRARLAKGDSTRALDAFRRASDLGSNDIGVLRGLVECAVAQGEPEEALLAQRRLLEVLPESDRAARADALHRLAVLHTDLGDPRRARFSWEKALDLDPGHRGALRALLEIAFAEEDTEAASELEDRLLDATTDREARLVLLRESAQRWSERAPSRAAESLEGAVALDPKDRGVRVDLVRAKERAGDARGTLSALEKLVRVEEDPLRKAQHLVAAARLLKDSLGDDAGAIAALERAMELQPSPSTFRALDAILVARGDDKARERAYLAMISKTQASGDRALEFELWHSIGDMRRARADVTGSLEAFRAASLLRPDDSHERRIVADLYLATDQTELAIAEILATIDREPLEAAHHKALYSLFTRTGDLDRAFCVAAVLCFLKAADGEQRACFAELRPKGVPHFRSALTRAVTLRSLVHPDLDRGLSSLFAVVSRAARTLKGRSVRLPPYAGAAREDPRSTGRIAAKAFFGAANVLGIPAPELLVRPELPTLLHALPIEAQTSLMGSGALSGWSVPELFFLCGKHLMSQHAEHGVRAAFPKATELAALRDATIEVVCPGTFPAEVRRTADVLVRELTRPEGVELKKVIETTPEVQFADVAKWTRGSEMTALRAALLLCGDLSIAAKIVRQEAVIPEDPTPNDKVKELVRFAVSEDYHVLRSSLGIAASRRVPDDDDEPTIERKLCA